MIKLFLDNLKVLATHPSQYGETEVLEMKNFPVPGAIPDKSRMRLLNPDQKENLRDQIDKWLEQGVIEPPVSPWVASGAHEEKGQTDKMGHRPERIE